MKEQWYGRDVLERLAAANDSRTPGPGVDPRQQMPLCQYHNHSIAHQLVQRLQAAGVSVRSQPSRMYASITVAFEDRDVAFEILRAFKETHPDTKPKRFSRDYDLVFLIGLCAIVTGACALTFAESMRYGAFALVTSTASLCLIAERWHRRYRYRVGNHYTVAELLCLMALLGLNVAVWKWVL